MNLAIHLFVIIAIGYLLFIGKSLFFPLIAAFFICCIIAAMVETCCKRFPFIPRSVAFTGSLFLLFSIILVPLQVVAAKVPAIIESLPEYEANIYALFSDIASLMPTASQSFLDGLRSNIDIATIITVLANGIKNFTSNFILVLVYVGFILAEKKNIQNKISTLKNDNAASLLKIVSHISSRVSTYVWLKMQLSILTALISYFIMIIIGLDFPESWALLVFVLNFIPNLGSIIATLSLALFALVQFETATPAFLILISIGTLQFCIGSILEPRYIGDSINLSPLVILISLVLWGNLWGIGGLFFSIPMTVIAKIILWEFDKTRYISVLLSGNCKN
jgi:predicted PurR-regulated permease PerM